ncbi:hypothetical protein [Streptomyces synnematoformans]|uniref:Uncharacterized protein n=1 Tax=Streptomyces synnematoformans TaxID=415721 RepID=A0ABN2XAU1_9ACTN
MHFFSVDYSRDRPDRWTFVNRGFWLSDIPRPLLLCRLLGHKPIVDGFGPDRPGLRAARWVCCDRCGVRPNPQGSLDPDTFQVGDRYAGPYGDSADPAHGTRTPGAWPKLPAFTFGGQLILGRSFPGWSAEFKVGNAGSEHTLEAHLKLWPLFALYLHTERLGTWLQRRLNPTGYNSRVTGLDISFGRLWWKLWAKRDDTSRSDPWWQHGSIPLDPRNKLLGRRHYEYENVGDPVTATVRMPHGDDHTVTLQLQRCTAGRRRRRFHSWTADWDCRPGIPTKPHGGEVLGSGVDVTASAVEEGTWPAEAAANIAAQLTRDRTRYGLREITTA